MKQRRNIYIIVLGFLIIINAIINPISLFKFGGPNEWDAKFHLKLANAWLNEENPILNKKYSMVGIPYPPAFHLTIALLSKLLMISAKGTMQLLKIITFPLILLSFFILSIKNQIFLSQC